MRGFKTILLFAALLCAVSARSQYITFVVTDKENGKPLQDVTVTGATTERVEYTDSNGVVTFAVLKGQQSETFVISQIGFFRKRYKWNSTDAMPVMIALEEDEYELEEVVITTTRQYLEADATPTRVDVVVNEEMEERSIDKPSSISHAVKEQPGVQIQRTAVASGFFNIRLQGLNGKYTQFVKDGMPLFGGFSNALGITQVPPMDLQQIEIIKGPASVLYGGDAIAGVINLVSKQPDEEGTYDVLCNVENTRSVDAGAYLSKKVKWFGFTLMGMYRYQKERDWNSDNFSDYPKLNRLTVTPTLYFYPNEHCTIQAGVHYAQEKRWGGTIQAIRNQSDSVYNYLERNDSRHIAGIFKLTYDFEEQGKLTVKQSVNYFNRALAVAAYRFGGYQLATLTELNYQYVRKKHNLIVGADFRSDAFYETEAIANARSYALYTAGFFTQYIYAFTANTSAEAGFRLDYNQRYGVFALPRIAVLHRFNPHFQLRANGGMGYKMPAITQPESEEVYFKNVQPIAPTVKPEYSAGGTVDFTGKLPSFNGLYVTLTQMVFYTHVFRPVQAVSSEIENCLTLDCELWNYRNMRGFIETRGIESGIKLEYRGFNVGMNYTLIDHFKRDEGVRSLMPITAKHQLALLAGYELFGKFSVGLDAYYFSPQKLSNGNRTNSIWELGLNTQLNLDYLVVFVNVENILDIRQTRYGPVVQPFPTFSRPRFAEIYAPLEGTILNAGFKLRIGKLVTPKNTAAGTDD